MNYTLTNTAREYNISFCDGFTSIVTGLSGAPYAIRHWELSNQCDPKYRLGHRAIAILQAIPLMGALASLIERIVVYGYNVFFNLNDTKQNFENPKILIDKLVVRDVEPLFEPVQPSSSIDVSSYEELEEKMKEEGSIIYVTDEMGKHPEVLLKVLGEGGSKKAIQLERGRALILPNMDVDCVDEIAERWERVVLEEVAMSKLLSSIGLLSPLSKQVNITLSESSKTVIPAYISETFESFVTTQGWFIIDLKNSRSSTWKQNTNYLFNLEEEKLNEKNWDAVMDTMLTDIAKICIYDIPVGTDSLNIAIVKKLHDSSETASDYEVRYFGFDFSSKNCSLSIPTLEKRSDPSHKETIERLLYKVLDRILTYEFSRKYARGEKNIKQSFTTLRDSLIERYTAEVLARIHQLIESSDKRDL